MAYPCPHCGTPVRKAAGDSGFSHGGLLACLLTSAMADFECPRCGVILREEFPPEVQQQMSRGSLVLVAVGVVVAMVVSFGLALYAM